MHETQKHRLKALHLRQGSTKRRLMLSESDQQRFRKALQGVVHNEVFVFNSSLGVTVFYLSEEEQSELIKETFLGFCHDEKLLKNLIVQECVSAEAVAGQIKTTLHYFTKHPQLFLAHAKKFVHSLRADMTSPVIVTILWKFFSDSLLQLVSEGKAPFPKKMTVLLNNGEYVDEGKDLVKELASDAIARNAN